METPNTIVVNTPNKRQPLDYVFGLVLLIGAGLGINHWYKKSQEGAEEKKVGEQGQEQATAASNVENALNPSGFKWLKEIDGTNAKQIFDAIISALNSGKHLGEIVKSYKKLTGASLDNDLKKGLTAQQYNTFIKVVTILSKRPDVKAGQFIVSKAKVITRKTPYINGTPRLIDRRGNSIDILDSGILVGIATGNQHISVGSDTWLADQQSTATLFFQVTAGAKDGKRYTIWVAASQVYHLANTTANAHNHKLYYLDIANYNKADAVNKPYLD